MQRIKSDLDEVLSLEDKKKILRDIHQDDLLELFKNGYAPQYRAPERAKSNSLDHQISITVSQKEKEFIQSELKKIKKSGPACSLSAYIRSKALSEIDLEAWYDKALKGLLEFAKPEWNPKNIVKERRKYIKMLDEADIDDKEENFYIEKKIEELDERLGKTKKKTLSRKYRTGGRVSFDEANMIRWRAARLSLSVADYVRFLVFDYLPFTEGNDTHLSLDARKRFYIAIADVRKNGFGEPPKPKESDIQKLRDENKILRVRLHRYEEIIKQNNISSNF